MEKITESESHYQHLEQMEIGELLTGMNKEDQSVPYAVQKAIPQVKVLVQALEESMGQGGRLFYIGAGTSGRLGILDASECPPTYGIPYDVVVGLIAGGDQAIRKAVEQAEDNGLQAWNDLLACNIAPCDAVIGIAASGTTPYVEAGIRQARDYGCITGCIVCNPGTPIAAAAQFPIEVITGPEFVTGSTRMKAGTATKLVLNMISTAVMIRLGRVKGNKMIDMKLSNAKLHDRGVRMIMQEANLDFNAAAALLLQYGNVRNALLNSHTSTATH